MYLHVYVFFMSHCFTCFIFSLCFPGLSIDYLANKLYWISSGNGTFNRCNLDGSGLDVIDSLKKELQKAMALAVMGE